LKPIRLILFAIFVSPSALTAAKADDAKAIQGIWKPVKAELAGKAMPDAVIKALTLKMDKNGYEVTVTGEQSDTGTCALDTKARPKGMTIKSVKGANAGKTFPAIYALKGDTLRICYDLSGAKRPTEFKTVAGTKLYLVTYKRQKK
jgi:uncharacterized protein (TIGR03067 family)